MVDILEVFLWGGRGGGGGGGGALRSLKGTGGGSSTDAGAVIELGGVCGGLFSLGTRYGRINEREKERERER